MVLSGSVVRDEVKGGPAYRVGPQSAKSVGFASKLYFASLAAQNGLSSVDELAWVIETKGRMYVRGVTCTKRNV